MVIFMGRLLYKSTQIAIVAVLFWTVAGCTGQKQEDNVTITVSYPSVQQFYRLYGAAFENKFPNIKVQVLKQDSLSNHDSVDVIYMNGVHEYIKAIEEGRLTPLYVLNNKGKSNFENQAPLVSELLRSVSSDGQLYALAPTFHSEVLYYNIDLFDQHHVPYPTDYMSWGDLFELAQLFPNRGTDGRELYGLQLNFYKQVTLNTILKAGETLQLSYIDPVTLQVTMNTDEWKAIWDDAVPAFRAGVIYNKEILDTDTMGHPAFYTQNAAMMVASSNAAYNFEPFSRFEDGSLINWGMVTAPVDLTKPDQAHFYAIYDFFGVSSKSEKAVQAFELIQFIATDPENSRRIAIMHPNLGLPSVLDHIQPIPGHEDMSAMYKLKPRQLQTDLYQMIDPEIIDAFKTVAQSYLDQVIEGIITTDEALTAIEAEGQEAIERKLMELESTND